MTTPVVLGIDPQSKRLGLALVEFEPPHRALWADTVSIDEVDGGWQYQQAGEALADVECAPAPVFEIVRVGIELPPYVNNRQVFRGLSIVFGLVSAECHRRWPWAPQVTCDVGAWKKAVLGNGKASKGEVREWAAHRHCAFEHARLWDLEQDSADALAIATYAAGVELVEKQEARNGR